jgi:hypothetical protein
MMLHLIRLSETGIRQFLNLCAHPSLPDAVQALQQVQKQSCLICSFFYFICSKLRKSALKPMPTA